MWLQARALDALTQTTLLAFSIEALHPVLDLVNRLLLTVKALDANEVESIAE